MADESDVGAIVRDLPGVTGSGDDPLAFRVDGKLIAWPYLERVDPKKARVPRRDIVVINTVDLDEKAALLASDSEKFFTTSHYDGYRAVLVRLAAVGRGELAELLLDSWRSVAAPARVAAYDGLLPPSIGKPATRALAAAGVTRLAELTTWSASDVAALHGVGPKAVRILNEHLESAGLTFAGE